MKGEQDGLVFKALLLYVSDLFLILLMFTFKNIHLLAFITWTKKEPCYKMPGPTWNIISKCQRKRQKSGPPYLSKITPAKNNNTRCCCQMEIYCLRPLKQTVSSGSKIPPGVKIKNIKISSFLSFSLPVLKSTALFYLRKGTPSSCMTRASNSLFL